MELRGATMGTSYSVKAVYPIEPPVAQEDLKSEIDRELGRINQLMSTYDPESELSRFNVWSSTVPFEVSPDTLEVIRAARDLYESTGGLFDPTVGPLVDLWGFGPEKRRTAPPSREEIEAGRVLVGMNRLTEGPGNAIAKEVPGLHLDLSAIAKGYGSDKVSELLLRKGFADHMVEIGGEIVVRGLNRNRKPWSLGIDSPDQPPGRRELIHMLALTNAALATSGNYRNFFEHEGVHYTHVIDPRTGYPVPDTVRSVTVIAPSCMRADGAATAVMVMGATRGLEWAERKGDLEALILARDSDGGTQELRTAGMSGYVVE